MPATLNPSAGAAPPLCAFKSYDTPLDYAVDFFRNLAVNPYMSHDDLQVVLAAVLGLTLVRFVLSGAYHPWFRRMPSVLKHLIAAAGVKDLRTQVKIAENMWYSLWHTSSFCMTLFVLTRENWFYDLVTTRNLRIIWQQLPNQVLTSEMRLYYLVELGFWLSCLLFVLIETRRKDFLQMVLHHFATIWLIFFSWISSAFRVGSIILLIHDAADIFLYVAKAVHAFSLNFLADIFFAVFALVFFVSRLIVFPFVVYSSEVHLWEAYSKNAPSAQAIWFIMPQMLLVLQALHCFWFYLILRMVKKFAVDKKVEKDIRSDSEDEDEGEERRRKNVTPSGEGAKQRKGTARQE